MSQIQKLSYRQLTSAKSCNSEQMPFFCQIINKTAIFFYRLRFKKNK